jgi:hypothetical protein
MTQTETFISFAHASKILSKTIQRMRSTISTEFFIFVINGTEIETDLMEAMLLSPAASEHLLIDSSTQQFVICNDKINPSQFYSLQKLIRGETISVEKSQRTSFLLLCRHLGNQELVHLFFGLWTLDSESSVPDQLEVNVVDVLSRNWRSICASKIGATLVDDFLLLSIDALDKILSSKSLQIESEDMLLTLITQLGGEYRSLFRHVKLEFLSWEGIVNFGHAFEYYDLTETIWQNVMARLEFSKPLPRIDSTIISSFPVLFSPFCESTFELLYRGSRDGFGAKDFHDKCDEHEKTITVLLDTEGYIFGGYTPVAWESREWNGEHIHLMDNRWKEDPSFESFVFRLYDPANPTATNYWSKKVKPAAIFCSNVSGPGFGCDLQVSNNCDTYCDTSVSDFLNHIIKVQEIEVFAVRD